MATIFGLPWAVTGSSAYTTDLAGITLGDSFFDARGRLFQVFALSNDLTGDTITANQIVYLATTQVTYPTGQSGLFTVTNTIANAFDAAADTHIAGVALGTSAEAASSAAADNRYMLFLVRGRHETIATNGDDDIAQGDYLISSSGNGTCDSITGTDQATTQTERTMNRRFGIALAADVDASDTVDGFVNCKGLYMF